MGRYLNPGSDSKSRQIRTCTILRLKLVINAGGLVASNLMEYFPDGTPDETVIVKHPCPTYGVALKTKIRLVCPINYTTPKILKS